MFLRSVLALAFLGVFLLAQPGNAETSDDFNEVDLFFYGDLDNGDGNISTMKPTSDKDTQSDCPQDSNQKSYEDPVVGIIGWYRGHRHSRRERRSGRPSSRPAFSCGRALHLDVVQALQNPLLLLHNQVVFLFPGLFLF